MLEGLKSWAMTAAGITVFGSICELILPSGSFQKYIRLAIGLVLILTIVTPIQRFLHISADEDIFTVTSQAYDRHSEMSERQKQDVILLYKQNLSQKIVASVKEGTGETAEAECDVEENDRENFGNVKKITVFIYTEESSALTGRIETLLKRDYGIEKEKITVRYKGM